MRDLNQIMDELAAAEDMLAQAIDDCARLRIEKRATILELAVEASSQRLAEKTG